MLPSVQTLHVRATLAATLMLWYKVSQRPVPSMMVTWEGQSEGRPICILDKETELKGDAEVGKQRSSNSIGVYNPIGTLALIHRGEAGSQGPSLTRYVV